MGAGRLRTVTAQAGGRHAIRLHLAAALERQGMRVPPYYAALLAAGIRSGRIGDVLGTLTLYARSVSDFAQLSSTR